MCTYLVAAPEQISSTGNGVDKSQKAIEGPERCCAVKRTVALTEDLRLVPNIYIYNTNSRGSITLCWSLHSLDTHMVHMWVGIHGHKIKKFKHIFKSLLKEARFDLTFLRKTGKQKIPNDRNNIVDWRQK